MVRRLFGTCACWVLDLALAQRCAGCGTIVADVHLLCPDCRKGVDFRGDAGCSA